MSMWVWSPRTMILVAGLLAGGALLIVGIYVFETMPTAQQSYYGISLSDGRPEVQYKLGEPTSVSQGPERMYSFDLSDELVPNEYLVGADPKTEPQALPSDKNIRTFNHWAYLNPNWDTGYILIYFPKSGGHVSEIFCYSENRRRGSCAPVLGVNIGDTEDEVLKRLGSPTRSELSDTLVDVTKTMIYQRLNVQLLLQRQRVITIAVGHFDVRN